MAAPKPAAPHLVDNSSDLDRAPTFNDDAPVWAKLMASQAHHASEERKEQTAVVRELAGEIRAHNKDASERAEKLLTALKSRDHGAEKAITDLAAEKGTGRRWIETITKELWTSFKVPLAGLVTAACAYFAWQKFQIPTVPTPVEVRVAPSTVTDPASTTP